MGLPSGSRGNLVGGSVLLFFGILFQLVTFGLPAAAVFRVGLPVALVVGGAIVLMQRKRARQDETSESVERMTTWPEKGSSFAMNSKASFIFSSGTLHATSAP